MELCRLGNMRANLQVVPGEKRQSGGGDDIEEKKFSGVDGRRSAWRGNRISPIKELAGEGVGMWLTGTALSGGWKLSVHGQVIVLAFLRGKRRA